MAGACAWLACAWLFDVADGYATATHIYIAARLILVAGPLSIPITTRSNRVRQVQTWTVATLVASGYIPTKPGTAGKKRCHEIDLSKIEIRIRTR